MIEDYLKQLGKTKTVKINKPHQCFYCCKKYEKFTYMDVSIFKYDSNLLSVYVCENCMK
jgi:hypothetical protein